MSELAIVPEGATSAAVPGPASSLVRFTPSDIARRQLTRWNAIQAMLSKSSGVNPSNTDLGHRVIC